MNQMIKSLGVGALMTLAAAVQAAPMTWSDIHTASEFVTAGETVEWSHDIRDSGFNAGVDSIFDYTIRLSFRDDANDKVKFLFWTIQEGEAAYFDQPGLLGDLLFEVDTGDYTAPGTILGRYKLEEDGFLKVSLTSLLGDFYFDSAELVANGDAASVPEPGSLALLGVGLVGLGLARRSARKNA